MLEIIFVSLFFFVSNFYTVNIPKSSHFLYSIGGLLKKYKNEYIMIYNGIYSSYAYKFEMKYDNITFIDEKYFSGHRNSMMQSIVPLYNNIIIYNFMFYAYVENNGKTNEIVWGEILYDSQRFETFTFNNDCLLICTWTYNFSLNNAYHIYERYDYQLLLIKPPYTEIYKEIIIETLAKDDNLQLISLKDYFVYIKIDEDENDKKNITYKFVDFDLNLVNSLTKEYENYSEIYFYGIPNDSEVNKFIIVFLKKEDMLDDLDIYKCQIIAYENKDLQIIQTIDIPISFSIKYHLYYKRILVFDENKIVFYFFDLNYANDYINILQYENQVLSFYKNFKNLKIQKLVDNNKRRIEFIMTEQGIAILVDYNFYYLSSICVPKTITLYANHLLKFPIEEFIFPGVEPIRFSFEEISDFITIYKNSTEIKKGQVFNDLENFTYFLEIKTFFKELKIKVKNHKYDFICDINIDPSIDTNISTYKDNQKCFKNNDYEEINNIVYSNLYDYFTVDEKRRNIQIELIMEREPNGPELSFYWEDHRLNCINNSKKIICNIFAKLFPRLTRIHLYSYLSCYNLVDVGWFELNDKNIFNIYSLIYDDFDTISKIYDPSTNIREYNPAMINYYYWFTCLSYCSEIKIDQKECCGNILDKWEIVFNKEYHYEKSFVDIIFDIIDKIKEVLVTKKEFDNFNENTEKHQDTNSSDIQLSDTLKYFLEKKVDIAVENIIDMINEKLLLNLEIPSILEIDKNQTVDKIKELVHLNKSDIFKNIFKIVDIKKVLYQFLYQYNFVILKNDEYKKIVVAFPGTSTFFELIDEFFFQGKVELDIEVEGKYIDAMENYLNIFNLIKEDLFDNLASIIGINDINYQVIFIGHSIGGAIATLSSFYYIKEYNFNAQNILITFGQPKVGNENFAKEFTNLMDGRIYRIARPDDIGTLFPLAGVDFFFKWLKKVMIGVDFALYWVGFYLHPDLEDLLYDIVDILKDGGDILDTISDFLQTYTMSDILYSHIGGYT